MFCLILGCFAALFSSTLLAVSVPQEETLQQKSLDIFPSMPGRVIKIFVKPGDKVQEKTRLFKIDSIKMEIPIYAPKEGIIGEIYCHAEDTVSMETSILQLLDRHKIVDKPVETLPISLPQELLNHSNSAPDELEISKTQAPTQVLELKKDTASDHKKRTFLQPSKKLFATTVDKNEHFETPPCPTQEKAPNLPIALKNSHKFSDTVEQIFKKTLYTPFELEKLEPYALRISHQTFLSVHAWASASMPEEIYRFSTRHTRQITHNLFIKLRVGPHFFKSFLHFTKNLQDEEKLKSWIFSHLLPEPVVNFAHVWPKNIWTAKEWRLMIENLLGFLLIGLFSIFFTRILKPFSQLERQII